MATKGSRLTKTTETPLASLSYTAGPSTTSALQLSSPSLGLTLLTSLTLRWEQSSSMAQRPTKIGVSVENLAVLPPMVDAAEKRIERLELRVGENLFNFMQLFCDVDGSRHVVPMDILDRWFKKF